VKSILLRAGTVLVVTVGLAMPAGAQTGERAVFGGARAGSPTGETLNVTVDLAEAYDQDVVAGVGPAAQSLFQGSGLYTTMVPQLDFATHGGRVQVGITAGASARYYAAPQQEFLMMSESAGAGFSVSLTSQTSISFNQNVAYSPTLFSGLFASVGTPSLGDSASPTADYANSARRSISYGTTAGLTHKFSTRATGVIRAGYHSDHFTGQETGLADVQSKEVGGQFNYSLSRDMKLRFGYTYRQGQYLGLPQTIEHNGDIGVDYSRPLSKTRKTSFAISVGPVMADGALANGVLANAVLPEGNSLDVRRQYRLVGDMSLIHQMGRTWNLKGTYHRGMGYIQGFQGPVFTEAYAASADGLVNRKTDLSLTAAYSTGDSALIGSASPFTTYTGDARVRYALNHTVAAYVEYLFYFYDIGPGIVLPLGIPPGLTRNGVRVGVTMWVPVRRR